MVLGALGIIVFLLLWGIIAGLPGSTDGGQEADRVTLRSRIKDSFTLDDMIRSMERENTGRSSLSPGYAESFGTVADTAAADTAGSGDEIRRIKELIRRNEQELGAGNVTVPPAPAAVKEDSPEQAGKTEAEVREPEADSVAEPPARRGFNSVRLVRQDEKNVVRAFVHSTQTVMVGSTLKMQLAENCLTDDGRRIHKGTPVFGEVTSIDGERVLVKITSVNLAGNILPFEKEVYSEDAMEGIYVPGNVKAETVKEAEAAGVSGANTNISGGLDMGSQIVAGAANSVINATKSAAGKNIRKVKVTIKTNYRILLKEMKK